jgi:Cu2+-containing amine oxidase
MTTQLIREAVDDVAGPQPDHPLDPLSADEIRGAVDIVKSGVDLTPTTRFVMISLAEPPKPADLDFASVAATSARPITRWRPSRAPRNVELSTARFWKITNLSGINELGQEVAFKLMPGATVPPMLQPGSAFYDRARFVQHNLWVTAYDPDEKYAVGNYPYQSPDAQGLPEYVTDEAPIADVVVWYTVGAHHVVRPRTGR